MSGRFISFQSVEYEASMTSRTKLQIFEVKVEEALEKAMNYNFDGVEIEKMSPNDSTDPTRIDDLIEKIATAEEEIITENGTSISASNIHDSAVIDGSVVEQLFGQKPTDELSGGTVHNTLLSAHPLPANDDITTPLNSISLKNNSTSRLYWNTTALSALWATGGAFIAHHLAPEGLSSLANIITFITSPTGFAVAAGTAIPILMSWGFAQLTKHSNELRNIAILITNAAQHLNNDSQNLSEKQAIVIGQTIRKEVATINEEIEHILGRAIELEAIVQGEVRSLEHAYSENETRIHTLVKELSNERIAILNHANRVQSTIKGTQEQLSDEFNLVTSQIATNVDSLVQTLSQTLQQQGEDLIAKLSQIGDGVTNQLVEKFNATTEQMQQKNEDFFHALGRNFDSFSEHFNNNEKQLERTFNETAVRAEMHITEIATHIQTATDQTLSRIDDKFKILNQTIIDRHNESLQDFDEKIIQLDKQADKISSQFDNITSEAIEAFENRLATVDLSLREHSDSIIEAFICRSQAIEDNAQKLELFLEAHTSQINANLEETTANIASTFTRGHDDILIAVDESKKLLREEITHIDNMIVDVIKERSQEFKVQFADQRDMMSEMLSNEKDKIANTLQDQIETLTQSVSTIEKTLIDNVQIIDLHAENHVANVIHCVDKLQETITQSCETTKDALEKHARNIDIRADALRDSLAINSFSLNEVLANQVNALEERMEELHNLIAKSDIHVNVVLKQQMDLVESAIVDNNKAITETVQNHIKNLEDHTEILRDTLSHSNGVLFESLEMRMGSFDEDLENRARQIFEHASMLEETLSQKLSQVCETIQLQTSVLEENSDSLKTSIMLNNEHQKDVQNALDASVDHMRVTLENSVNTITDSLQDKIIQASDIISSTGEQMLSSLHDKTDKVQEKLSNFSHELTSIIADQVEKSENSILSTGHKFISSVSDVAEKAENMILESGNRIVSNIEQTIQDTSQNAQALFSEVVNTSTTAIEQLLTERSGILYNSIQELENNLEYRLTNISNSLETTSNQTAAQISGHVEQLAELTDHLNQVVQHTAESLNNLTQHVGEQLSLSAEESEKRIFAQNQSLVDIITQTSSETIQTMTAAKEDLINNISSILQQLNLSICNIHENSDALMSTVQNIDGQFNETANNFFQNTNQVAEYLSDANQELSNNMEILQKFVRNTFEKISNVTNNFGEHAKTLSEVINTLEKSENVLDATLTKRQNALSTLSNSLIAKSDEVNQLIEHYENVLNLAFERTDENTRNSTQLLQQTLNQIINEATTCFSGAAEDIRRSANEIRLELSKVNNDVNDTIQKLPEKINGTTDTIRYTLDEKVTKLKDLANVVQSDNNKKKENQLTSEPLISLTPNKDNDTSSNLIKRIVPSASILQKDQNKINQNKWVSDLLARASSAEISREEMGNNSTLSQVKTEARLMNTSLHSLAASIIKSINHDAIVELWNHYKRGQNNIVTERLYTKSGQIIFEKIKQKYMSDPHFKYAVNQYIIDFEKVLRDVSRNTKDMNSARHYLTSDSGKVYTILAHASGRIK